MNVFDLAALAADLGRLGVRPGSVLIVHSSYKSLGSVDGGAATVVAALRQALGPEGTLVMPAMSDDDEQPFDRAATPCRSMGVIADTFWRLPGVVRSDNPASFAATGPLAAALAAPHPIAPPHGIDSPVGRAAALGGFVLLLGVGHSANTTVHLAESIAAVPYRARKYCMVWRDGAVVRIDYDETDHCCERFAQLDPWLRERGLQRDGRVGKSAARLMRAGDVVRVAVERLRQDPCVFLHSRNAGCAECAAAWNSIG
jgi:aminoglycoside 3-N-acetyltransferase